MVHFLTVLLNKVVAVSISSAFEPKTIQPWCLPQSGAGQLVALCFAKGGGSMCHFLFFDIAKP